MIVKTPGSQMGSPAAAEEGGEEVGGERWESTKLSPFSLKSSVTARPKIKRKAPKMRMGIREDCFD